jgi:hypothetical protein
MLSYTTRQLGRIAGQSAPLVKELTASLRPTAGKAQLCAVISAGCLSREASSSAQVKPCNSVQATCCGFPKELIGGPSCVLDHGVFGEDACFISKYKNIHVAGNIYPRFILLLSKNFRRR